MYLNEKIMLDTVMKHDLSVVYPARKEILRFIRENPFAERINFLLTHQDIAKTPVKNKMEQMSAPNCLGTAFFVAGVSDLPYPYHAYSYELNLHMEQPGEKKWDDFFWTHYERRVPGAFVFSYCLHSDGWHAGIHLGMIAEEEILFAQHGHGESFGIETISRNYSSPDYYIPKTLIKT